MAKPTHRILQVEDRGEGKKPYWREVGVGFTNSDSSLNLVFAVIPMIGVHTIQVRPITEREEGESQQPQQQPAPTRSTNSRRK